MIRDNDCKCGESFKQVAAQIEVIKTPLRAPKVNAICERFLGSLRREYLDLVLILSERHLYRVVKEYKECFNFARPHQGIEQRIPCRQESPQTLPINGKPASRSALGGLHHDYCWLAASCTDQGKDQPQAHFH